MYLGIPIPDQQLSQKKYRIRKKAISLASRVSVAGTRIVCGVEYGSFICTSPVSNPECCAHSYAQQGPRLGVLELPLHATMRLPLLARTSLTRCPWDSVARHISTMADDHSSMMPLR